MPMPGTKIYADALQQGKIPDEVAYLKSFSEQERGGDTITGNFVPLNMTQELTDEELVEARNEINAVGAEIETETGLPNKI